MKKLVLVLVLGLLIQAVPARVLASYPNQPASFVPIAIAAGVAVFGFNILGGKATAQTNRSEFAALNDNPAFNHLLKQMAGGSLNTAEILKK